MQRQRHWRASALLIWQVCCDWWLQQDSCCCIVLEMFHIPFFFAHTHVPLGNTAASLGGTQTMDAATCDTAVRGGRLVADAMPSLVQQRSKEV